MSDMLPAHPLRIARATLALILALPLSLAAQSPVQQVLASWQQLTAPTEHEARATVPISQALDGWQRDGHGNLMLRRGRGTPRRVVACAIDRPGFTVTQITDDGYLRLGRVASGGHPRFDQAHEAQQVNIITARGTVPGVIAATNAHIAASHRADSLVVTADDLWLDVGASSRAEVVALGIQLRDPVERRVPAWPFAGGVAGGATGSRAGCAAIAAAARGMVERGETIFLMTTQGALGWPGLGSALARLGAVNEVTVVVAGRDVQETRWIRPGGSGGTLGINAAVFRAGNVDSIRAITPGVRFAGSLVETISDGGAAFVLMEVVQAAGVTRTTLGTQPWISAPATAFGQTAPSTDAQASTAAQLKTLADIPGTPGDEWRVREAVKTAMPAWARALTVTDAAGNLILGMGPERDTIVFIAQLDEVAFDVVSIAHDGVVTLRSRGGAVASAWEGQPALLHLVPRSSGAPLASIAGVFVPRDNAPLDRPERLTAWFGLDSAELVAQGVRVGDGVTSHKDAVRLAGTRFTGGALADRAGSYALLRALNDINPARLTRRVLFVWSTSEDMGRAGAAGAAALADRLGASVQRVHSIGTVVSPAAPLESPPVASAQLGGGPVLRAIESTSMAAVSARAELLAIAARAGIPLQIGLTQGGTDGTVFTYYGAPNVPISWPGRYSHAPGEVLDLRDIEQLAKLIAALASAPR